MKLKKETITDKMKAYAIAKGEKLQGGSCIAFFNTSRGIYSGITYRPVKEIIDEYGMIIREEEADKTVEGLHALKAQKVPLYKD